VFPAAIVVTLLVVGTLVALVRRPILGFLGFWFLAILAPTSLVPVATQTIAEHRMYLPLAALAVLAALAIAHMPGKGGRAAVLALAAVLGMATARRNDAYASEETLWRDNIAKKPDDARAYNNLGNALYMMGRIPEAAEQYGHALQLQPDNNPEAQYNLGNCFLEENRLPEALSHFSEAVRLAPDNSGAHNNFGKALAESGRLPEAMVQFRDALQINPNDAEAHNNVGTLWYLMGRKPEAIAEYEEALRINPNFADARASLDHLQAGSK
jgi:tetratricopeptide (TPR) repeat protein